MNSRINAKVCFLDSYGRCAILDDTRLRAAFGGALLGAHLVLIGVGRGRMRPRPTKEQEKEPEMGRWSSFI